MEFSEYIDKNKRVCRFCRFQEENPEAAASIKREFSEGKLAGKSPTSYATLIAKYLIEKFEFPIVSQHIHDHFRRGHEGRPIA